MCGPCPHPPTYRSRYPTKMSVADEEEASDDADGSHGPVLSLKTIPERVLRTQAGIYADLKLSWWL